MTGAHTERAFEDAIERHLLATGWSSGNPEHYDRELGIDTATLYEYLGASQVDSWNRIVEIHGDDPDEAQRAFAKELARQLDNKGALEVLRHGVKYRGVAITLAYFRPAHTIAEDALDAYRTNVLTVTRQLRFSTTSPNDSVDLALFVNGIPVATAELKNELTGQSVEHAKAQYRQRDPREVLFARRAVVHFAVDPRLVFITTRLAGDKTRFLPFNVGTAGPGRAGGAGNPPAGPGRHVTGYLWEQIWAPDTWLDLLRRFVHVEDPRVAAGKGRSHKPGSVHLLPVIFPRFHQWHAVVSLADHAARHGSGHNYLVMHSAGSGKSNTIGWTAHRLAGLHTPADPAQIDPAAGLGPNEPVFDKVIIITDRRVLDRQLQETVYQFEHQPGVVERIDKDSAQLAAALQGETAKIIITTLQKFPFVLDKVSDLRGKRFAMLVDEAHSSQSGEAAADLKRVLLKLGSDDVDADGDPLTAAALARGRHATLSFFAFTATPKAKTLNLFGTPDPGTGKPRPFHVYSMRQANEEGFILDVLRNYLTYQAYWRVANQNPDDRRVDQRDARRQLARFVSLHETNLAQKAEVIVEHFRQHTAPRLAGRAKAMVVTESREHAVRTYHALRRYAAEQGYRDCGALVAFSGSLTLDGDPTELTEASLNGFGDRELADRFAYLAADDRSVPPRYDREFRILVVAEMYQTGFDQPLLTTMYVDKLLDGVAAVQTLSRLNRTHPLKSQEDVFVLDLRNEAEQVQEAFRPFYESATTAPSDPLLLYQAADEVHAHGLLVGSEIEAFTTLYLTAREAPDPRQALESAHADLYRLTDPARDRYADLLERDRDAAEEFRAALRGFTRVYGFLSQIVGFVDRDLEGLYQFGRYLLRRLPRRDDPTVDIGEVQLSHLRVTRTGEHDLSLAPEGEQELRGFATGSATAAEPELVSLAQIIATINERYGLGLTDGDRVWWEQQIVASTEDPEVEAAALVNSEVNFAEVFNPKFDDVVIDRQTSNEKQFRRFFTEDTYRHQLTDLARRAAYQMIRRRHALA